MYIKQISTFVDNKMGSIASVISILGEASINIKALSVADAADYGILRIIVDNPTKACEIIKSNGYEVKIADTLGIEVNDKANGLAIALNILKEKKIPITYIYSLITRKEGTAICIIKTPNLSETESILKDNNVRIVEPSEIYEE